MGDLNAEQIKTLADVLGPMIEKALRPEFQSIRSAIETHGNQLRAEMEKECQALRKEIAAVRGTNDDQERRIADLEATRWKILMSYGAIVAVVTLLFHAVRFVDWSKFLPFIKKGS